MNRNQQQLYTDIKKIAVSLEQIVKILEKKLTEKWIKNVNPAVQRITMNSFRVNSVEKPWQKKIITSVISAENVEKKMNYEYILLR